VSADPRSTFSFVAGASDACFVFSSSRAGILLMMLICGLGCVLLLLLLLLFFPHCLQEEKLANAMKGEVVSG